MTALTTKNVDAELSSRAGRYGHHCELYEERQMIVIGGNIILDGFNVIVNSQGCNTSYPAIRLLDISTFKWQEQFNPGSEPYAVPKAVLPTIGGTYVQVPMIHTY